MTHKLIKIKDYLLIGSDDNIKRGFYYCVRTKNLFQDEGEDVHCCNGDIRIIAHLPLNGSPILKGVDLLPSIEDGVDKLANEYFTDTNPKETPYQNGLHIGFKVGFNKAREKYKYTEEDIRKAIDMARELDGLHYKNGAAYKIIQSLNQYPTEFECEVYNTEELESVEIDWMIIGRPKRITTAQGIQWVGKYK